MGQHWVQQKREREREIHFNITQDIFLPGDTRTKKKRERERANEIDFHRKRRSALPTENIFEAYTFGREANRRSEKGSAYRMFSQSETTFVLFHLLEGREREREILYRRLHNGPITGSRTYLLNFAIHPSSPEARTYASIFHERAQETGMDLKENRFYSTTTTRR